VAEMSGSEAPPEAGTGPDSTMPSRRVRICVLAAWLAASAFLLAATFSTGYVEDLVCDKCDSTMIAVEGPVLLPMPGPEIIEAGEGADECDHEWRVRPRMWDYSRSGSVGYALGLLFWLVLVVRMGLSLAKPIGRRARVTSLVLAAVAVALVVGGDIWFLADLKSKVDYLEIHGLGSLNAADLYSWRVIKAATAWHIAAAAVCFGGAVAWFAWMIRLPEPGPDLD
jgi:hypothetical protein